MALSNVIETAFEQNPKLLKRVFEAINSTPQYSPLFEDIARYHLSSTTAVLSQNVPNDGPNTKKRKLNGTITVSNKTRTPILQAKDISFTLPQRKKFHLGIAQHGTTSDFYAPTTTFSIFATNPTTTEVEFEVPLSDFAHAIRLPVPEKAAKQFNFCLVPKPTSSTVEPLIWTVPDGPLKTLDIPSTALSEIAGRSESGDPLGAVFDHIMSRSTADGHGLTLPDAEEFASATPESHRKQDIAYHVKAFRGSKDGYLWFLETGIFYGFKKPLSFFALEDIESVSYTSVLQRTFNLNIAFRDPAKLVDGGEVEIEEIEYSMLDQSDFAGIDAYIKSHGLQDASLAESRRAKKLNVNGNNKNPAIKVEGEDGDQDENDDRTELEKAQQQLEDEEDEDEEDYDPGSDGESEGSGFDSDDDSDDTEDSNQKMSKTKSRNLVAEELGSEAEDVSVTEDEEGDEDDEMQEGEEEGEEEQYDEEEAQEEDVKPAVPILQATNGFASVATAHRPQGRWGYPSGPPDPYDEDQL